MFYVYASTNIGTGFSYNSIFFVLAYFKVIFGIGEGANFNIFVHFKGPFSMYVMLPISTILGIQIFHTNDNFKTIIFS